MSFENFLNQFNGIYEFDKLEDPYNSHENFSDESLIRALRKRNDFTKIKLIPRDLDIKTKWLDRSWWPKEPPVSVLDYVCVNFPRPLFENRGKCEFLLNLYFPEGYPWVKKEKVKLFSKIMWEYKRKDWKILFKLKAIQGRLVSKFKN